MDTVFSKRYKLTRVFANILSIVVILSVAFPATSIVAAAAGSPFVGHWEAIDVDGSDIRLSIGGPPSGPFQITWTESKDDSGLGFCEGGPGIVRGTGSLNEDDPFALEADLWVECFTIEKSMEFHLTFRYIPSTDTLATTYSGGLMVVFTHPRSHQASPAQVRLMTNYQEDWASGFYEEGHTVWLAVTESDGISVKATAEMVTGPQPDWDGGEIGFASQPWEWQPEQPDIMPNDWVYAWVDNGASAQMQVGEISAWVDLENDQVLGTVSASWYSQEVYIYCLLWGVTDARDDMIMADGSEGFTCSWSGGAYDIQPGDVAEVQYYGPDGHAVDYYLFIPNPVITVFPESEYLQGYDWPEGATVTITVEDKPECFLEMESSGGFFDGNFPESCDLIIGDIVTYTDGATTRTHVVRNLAITGVDLVANTVAGTADIGDVVSVGAYDFGGESERWLTVEDGNWLADFTLTDVDLSEGMCGYARIYDEVGNWTQVDWCIPNPRFTVFPEWEWFDGNDWPDGAMVDITVLDKTECTTQLESSGGFFNGPFGEGCDLVIGDTVTFTDGVTTRTHIVQNLAVTNVDKQANTVAGTADEGATIYTWVHEYGYDMELQAEGGTWLANFETAGLDLVENMGGRAEIRDEFGNATAVDWWIPNPHFTVFPEWEWFDGNDWPDGVIVTITVEGKPECATEGVSSDNFFNGGFPEDCDIAVDDAVTFTDGVTTRTHIVQNLAITAVDKVINTVSGTANVGALVYAWVHEYGYDMELLAEDGTWLADFGLAGLDLMENMGGRAEIRDEFGNGTAVDWWIPNPRFTVFPEWEWFDAMDWPEGATVNIAISDKPLCGLDIVSPGDFFNGGFPEGCDLVIGDTVTFTDGVTTRTHIVQNLAVTNVDKQANTVAGTADEGATIYTWVHEYGYDMQLQVEGGTWLADFGSAGLDLVENMGGRSEIRDEFGNATAVDWYIPNPHIVASITDDWFYLVDFAPNVTFEYSVYESLGGTQLWQGNEMTDSSGSAWINADGHWDFVPGTYLVVSDGISTKDLVIEGFTFDVFDLTHGLLQGTAPGPEGRLVWVGIGFEIDGWSMEVLTDMEGNWVADFGAPVPADYQWVAAQIFDDDGDASELRPAQIISE